LVALGKSDNRTTKALVAIRMRYTEKENTNLELIFPPSKIRHYADLYDKDYDKPIENLVSKVKKNSCLTADDLLALDEWKLPTKRNQHNIKKNEQQQAGFVEDMTELAFSAKTELGRVQCLLALKGVQLPVGSAILHWFHDDCYPIWDFRARESVQYDESLYDHWFKGWIAYVNFCRKTAKDNEVCMRTLARALWKYSKMKSTGVI
jgi:hypothetical protein